jgi:CBS domain-containing protein
MRARDAMTSDVVHIGADEPLGELERLLLAERLGGVPVLEGGRLVGVVSRSDLLRVLGAERALAEAQSDFYREFHEDPSAPSERAARELEETAAQVARRMERLRVRDAMTLTVECVDADAPLREVAERMVARRIHRVVVTEGDRLAGIVSALDLVRLVADGSLR